jgi:hypothetical protein
MTKETEAERDERFAKFNASRDLAKERCDFLNTNKATYTTHQGKVTLEFWADDRFFATRKATAEELETLGLDQSDHGYVEGHPEGSDRGGYVPTLTNGCYYDEGAGDWRSS